MLTLFLATVLTAVASERHALVEEYLPSVAIVKYYLKEDAKGREPNFKIPYLCPNCSKTHWRDKGTSAHDKIPAVFAGYVTAKDEIMLQDVKIPPEFIERITVTVGKEMVEAVESEACVLANALVLKTAKPLEHAKPLVFTGKMPEKLRYFYILDEDGLLVSGIKESAMADFTHYLEPNVDLYKGQANTILLDETGKSVTLSFQTDIKLGEEIFTPPSSWTREKASLRFERKATAEKEFAESFLPVYIQLESLDKSEERMRGFYSSGGDVRGNDIDTVLVALEDKLIVCAQINQNYTSRIIKMEVTLPDGTKEPLEFVGSLADYGAMIVKFANGTPKNLKALKIDRREAASYFNEQLKMMYVKNASGVIKVKCGDARVSRLARGKDDVPHVVCDNVMSVNISGEEDGDAKKFLVSTHGLVKLPLKDRKEGRYSSDGIFHTEMIALVEAPVYDPENVPRAAEDRHRMPWLGVDAQTAPTEVIREKKAMEYVKYSNSASLVTTVYDDSPAAKLGIKEGDILLTIRQPGGPIRNLESEYEYFGSVDWDSAFEDPEFAEIAESGRLTPWPNVEGGVNSMLAENFGVGMKVIVAWVSDGKRKEGETTLALAPVHFMNAPKARNKELALTVCDMTDEVRKFFGFGADAPGVIVRKVKSGGVAAVSGLLPLEIILDVNGEGVKNAKDFVEKTKGKKELNLTVRRLSATRMVPIRL